MVEPRVRRGGRQAEAARNDDRLVRAARELIAHQGADASVAAIAARAGIGVAGLYRRFPHKAALLQHLSLTALRQTAELAAAADTDRDPAEALRWFVRQAAEQRCGGLSPVAGTIETTAEMDTAFLAARRGVAALIGRARGAGLRTGVNEFDVLRLAELFGARAPDDEPAESEAIPTSAGVGGWRRLLTIALDGLFAVDSGLPGPAPGMADYGARWMAPPT